jgi:hypothetical protein
VYFAKPSSSFGYYRGWPIYGGDGSGQGVEMAGTNVFSAGQGSPGTTDGSTWTPTILYLFVLIIVEMFVFAFIARRL